MSVFVVDASVAAKWLLPEEADEPSHSLLTRADELHAPEFFLLEVDNVLCKWLRRGSITAAIASEARQFLRATGVELHPFAGLHDSAYAIANETRRSLYDCLYVALAVRLDGKMVTADRKLYDAIAAGPFTGHVVWVGDV